MNAYIRTYQLASTLALVQLRPFDIPITSRVRYVIKSGNLALCFLGFSTHSGETFYKRSADLGVLASIFDLASDGLRFDSDALCRFRMLVDTSVAPDTAKIIFDLMERKQAGRLQVHGLDRGVDALRIVIKHLGAEEVWKSDAEIYEAGILCQIADDILDYKDDIARDALNFLRHDGFHLHIQKFLRWNFERQFRTSQHPAVLFKVIRMARKRAIELVANSSLLTKHSDAREIILE